MPKLNKAGRKAPRPQPYPKKDPKKSSDTIKNKSHPQPDSPFLNLPSETRLTIYGYFLQTKPHPPTVIDFPATRSQAKALIDGNLVASFASLEESRKRHDREISITRKSLNLVCRKITAEWSPLFYRTTTITVHRAKTKWVGYHTARYCNPPSFAHDFLRVLHPSKLANIKKIAYDVPKDDVHFVADFPKHLVKYISKLTSLESLSIRCDPHKRESHLWISTCFIHSPKSIEIDTCVRRESPVTSKCYWEDIELFFLGLGKNNTTLPAKKLGAGIFEGWDLKRTLFLKTLWQPEGSNHCGMIGDDVEFVFHKPKMTATGQATELTVTSKLSLENWMGNLQPVDSRNRNYYDRVWL
ncbi:hypothetical protein LTR84_011333 [Exophiala bonariae]|uniref:Uncharacterized protein n=1 Tax=Exophiala bonariae TaxID=1690606 RepID=A0AAV9MRX3_9EURO|nr:hypothetical protein LTR84_011333 [Exophiala bonariae]